MSILDGGKADMVSIVEESSELARLKAENAALMARLEAKKSKGEGIMVTVQHGDIMKEYVLSLKVSDNKGALSIYGVGRFPITAYPLIWLAILSIADEIKAFITKNSDKLSWAKATE